MAAASRPANTDRRPASKGKGIRPFLGLLDPVTLKERGDFEFECALALDDVAAAWTWMLRDLAADLIDEKVLDESDRSRAAVEALMPDLIGRAQLALDAAAKSPEAGRRLTSQVGGEEARDRLPFILAALRCRGLFDKAQGFGRAANGLSDEGSLTLALQSLVGTDQTATPFLMFAMVGQMAQPMRLVSAAIRSAGEPTEPALIRTGFGPLVDSILAHAQDQIPVLTQVGTFGDMDLICRAVDRYHRLMRAVIGLIELMRGNSWARMAATLTKHVSDKLDPKLRDVAPDVNKSLRRREGTDRIDSDQVLSALNGMYLLATIRDCRDSLALNTLFDQVWSQVGQALEIHIDRLLDALRAKPSDSVASARLDAALKMAAIRFGQDYADTLRRAKETTVRRLSS
jgi:hypothetical protein